MSACLSISRHGNRRMMEAAGVMAHAKLPLLSPDPGYSETPGLEAEAALQRRPPTR